MKNLLFLLMLILSMFGVITAQNGGEFEPITVGTVEDLNEIVTLGRGWVRNIEWSPDDERLAVLTATGVYIHGDNDFTTLPEHIEEIESAQWYSGESIFVSEDYKPIDTEEVIISHDNSRWMEDIGSGLIVVSSSDTGEPIAEKQIGTGARRLLFSNDGERVIVETWTGEWGTTIFDWNVTTDQITMLPYEEYGGPYISDIAISFDDTLLAVADEDNHVRIFDLSSMELAYDLRYSGVAHALSFSPDSQTLVSGSETFVRMTEAGWDNSIFIWDVTTHILEDELNGHQARVRGLDFSLDGRYLLSVADWYDDALLWNLQDGEIVFSQPNAEIPYVDGFFMPLENQIVLHLEATKVVQAWTIDELEIPYANLIPTGLVARAANISNDGRTFAITDGDTHIYSNTELSSIEWTQEPVFDFSNAQTLPKIEFSASTSVAFNLSDTLIAVGQILDQGGFVEVWNVESLERQASISVHEDTTVFGNNWVWVAYSANGDFLLAVGSDQLIAIDANSLEVITRKTLTGRTSITSLAFSPDGRFLAVGTEDGTIRLWGVPAS